MTTYCCGEEPEHNDYVPLNVILGGARVGGTQMCAPPAEHSSPACSLASHRRWCVRPKQNMRALPWPGM